MQAIDRFHHDLLLDEHAKAGKTSDIRIEAYVGSVVSAVRTAWMNEIGHALNDSSPAVPVTLAVAEYQIIDRDTEALYFDLIAAFGALKTFDENSRISTIVFEVLDKTLNILDFRHGAKSEQLYASIASAHKFIQSELYGKYKADPALTPAMLAVGHAHIDTAWLWPLAHTREKIGRTFTSQLTFTELYPDYVFTCSQPQQYAYIKEDYPEVFERIKGAIKRGQWETVGGMWVESDCNVVSGESLVRQFLFGQRFFEKEFGQHNDVLWLPDVFGYAANIPQIIKKSGMKYFMTIKIYWSQVNKPPYQTFEWEGIDGTSVLTHFAPGGDYNANVTPEQTVKFWNAYKQKNLNDSALYIFGYGDGGGGPTRQMLESAKRLKSFPGMPRVKHSSAQHFFESLEKQVEGNPMLPRWVGELYLEYHRGTYTSQADNKQFNRRSEIALQTAEQLSSLAMLTAGAEYPQEQINKAWELTLLNQFHDIIPGSSIAAVYEDSDKDYAAILGAADEAISGAITSIAASVAADPGELVVYNPLSFARADAAAFPRSYGLSGQDVTDLKGNLQTLVSLPEIPSLGYAVLPRVASASSKGELSVTPTSLENDYFKITLDKKTGEITSLLDKRTGAEVIDQNSYCKGNALLSFEDRPLTYDAWDIDIFYQDKMYAVTEQSSMTVVEDGPLRASIEIKREFGRRSTVTQRMSVWRDLSRIDFDTLIDWQERSTLLKAAFPVNVHSPKATFDIQFGNVERPTHWNTSWDWARFEVCGHKWADLSEGGEHGYGVALLSDSKYGWDIKGNVMRLTLLKGAETPDPGADIGIHHFTYSLMPHVGDWRSAGVVQRAYELNVPVKAAIAPGGGTLPNRRSFLSTDSANIVIETIKKAEDDDSIIVRLYESFGQRGAAKLTFFRNIKSAKSVNLMENETAEAKADKISVSGDELSFSYTPYEIKTFKINL